MSSALAQLTDYGTDEVPSNMEVRTERVEPIQSSSTDLRYIFRLEPQGYLDSNTLLQFKLNRASGATGDQLRVNSFNGALGAVKRCIFRVGDFILNDSDGVNQWSTWFNLARQRRVVQNRYHAWYLGNQFVTSIDSDVLDTTFGQYQMDDTLGGYNYGSSTSNSLRITTTSANNFKYGIPLGLLIPALKDREIPLFLFSEYKIYIEVEFYGASEYCNANTATTLRAGDADLDAPSEIQLLCDYIVYPSSILERDRAIAMKEGGLVLNFFDVVKIERQLTVTAGTDTSVTTNAEYLAAGVLQNRTTEQEFRIGQEGREVHTLLMWKKFQAKDSTAEAKALLGQRCDSIASESIQWKINGIDVYPEPQVSRASQYDANYLALGYQDLQVERPMFFGDTNSLVAGLTPTGSGLQGTFCTHAYDARTRDYGVVGSGTYVGRYPIVCRYKCTPAVTLSGYSTGDEGNQITLKQDGNYDIDFFAAVTRTAVIQSTVKGMEVSVTS